MEKSSFLFYLNWEEQVDIMDDDELRRFIKNLCRDARGEEVDLPTKSERLCWLGIAPALAINKVKYEKRVESNRENGKSGGAPKGNQNAKKMETTQNNPNNPIRDKRKEEKENREEEKENRREREEETDKSKEETETRKEENDKSKEKTVNSEEENGKSKEKTVNTEEATVKREMEHTRTRILGENMENEITIGKKNIIQLKKPERRNELTMYKLVNSELIDEYPNWEEDLDNLGPDLFTDKYYKGEPGYLGFAKNIYSFPKI